MDPPRKIFLLQCKTLEEQDRIIMKSLIKNQERNKREWKIRYEYLFKRDYNSEQIIVNDINYYDWCQPRHKKLPQSKLEQCAHDKPRDMCSPESSLVLNSRLSRHSNTSETKMATQELKLKYSRYTLPTSKVTSKSKCDSPASTGNLKTPSEKGIQIHTISHQMNECSTLPIVSSESRVTTSDLQNITSKPVAINKSVTNEFQNLSYGQMVSKIHRKTLPTLKECLAQCEPELGQELEKLDPNIEEDVLKKTMLQFVQFDSVRRSLTEVERIKNIVEPGLMSGERIKHWRNFVNQFLEKHGLSDEHGPVDEPEEDDGSKPYHEMSNEDQQTLDKFQTILESKQQAKVDEDETKKRQEVLPQLKVEYSIHPQWYNDKVKATVLQVNVSVAKASSAAPHVTPQKEHKSAFYNLSKKFDPKLKAKEAAAKKKSEQKANGGNHPILVGNRKIVPVPQHRRYQASTMTLAERKENAQELMAKFHDEATNAPVIDKGVSHRMSTNAYSKFIQDNSYNYGIPPQFVEEPRVRRKIEEGSYPNWTVREEFLPSVLRYAWKGKLKKLGKRLEDEKFQLKINNVDNKLRTALHYAASWGCIKTLDILLQCPGIDINHRDCHGKTPLYKAMEIGSQECVKALIKAGADTRIKAKDSRDAITYLLHFHGDERFEIFKLLWDASPRAKEESKAGEMTLLHMALMGNTDVIVLKCVDYMICQGLDVNAREGNGRTAAHIATIDGKEDILQLLMAHQMNPLYEDLDYKSVIDYADSKISKLLKNYFKYGPGDIDTASKLRDGNHKQNKKMTEDYRTEYFGHRFL